MKTAQANNDQLTGKIELLPALRSPEVQRPIDLIVFNGYSIEARELVDSITVTDSKSEVLAVDSLKRIKVFMKECDDIRKAKKEPFFEMSKRIDAAFKPILDTLAECEKKLKDKLNIYLQACEKKRQEEQAAAQKKFEEDNLAALEQRAFTGEDVQVDVPVPVLQKTSSQGNYGSASQKSVWRWELQDITKVPVEYLAVDEAKVNALVKAGTRQIAGLRIYEEKVIAVR